MCLASPRPVNGAQAVSAGAHPLTMPGLAGMGDLVLTCTGALGTVCSAACLILGSTQVTKSTQQFSASCGCSALLLAQLLVIEMSAGAAQAT